MQGARWFCFVDGKRLPYDDDDTAALEQAFVQDQNGVAKVRGGSYEVNFKEMTQRNLQSGFSRRIERVIGGKVRKTEEKTMNMS